MTDRTDNFNRSNGGLGANWTTVSDANVTGTLGVSGNKAAPTANNVDAGAYWSADTFQNDQYAEGVHTGAGGASGFGPMCRTSTAGGNKWYEWNGGLGGFSAALYLYDNSAGGNWSLLFTGSGSASGDLIRLEATGTSLVCKINGTTVNTSTDATLASGSPGIRGYVDGTATGFIDDWLGGPIAAAGAAPFIPVDTSIEAQPSFPVSLRTWIQGFNLNLLSPVEELPPGRRGVIYDDPSRGYLPAGGTWTWRYNANLIGKDVFPPGRLGLTYDDPSRGYLPQGRTWTWQYNLNLVAKDILPPGRQRSERPAPVLWYREWTQNLLLSTLSVTVQRPFNQYDWPLPVRAAQPDRTWVSSAAMLQLILPPPGDIWTDLPPAPQFWRRDWSQNLVLSTLVGQDSLPPGQQRTETPPPVSWRRDWTQSLVLSTLAGQDSLPPGAVSNRILVAAPQQRDWAQNLLLSTLTSVIQTPFNQYDWTIPQRAQPAGQTWTLNLLLSTLAPAIVLPLNQYDWPVPQRATQPDRGFASSFNLNLIAQDQLPFRQSDWPLPQSYYYPLSVRGVAPLNLNLFPPPPPVVAAPATFRNPMFIGNTTGQMGSWS